ncbi:MAG TPA: polyketide synthase dehydratase domain-containing protein, partial [Gammaproteobacteria bacterium]|nr:polyketide synthase dehydratase domain-containing protein [Gammaproteobacteria bacterium]
MEALCKTHVLGCELDYGKLFPLHGEFVRLPHYPWQRESLWFERTSESFGLLNRAREHPLLGYRLSQVEGVWEQEIDLERMPWLADHVVGGSVVFPAAGFIELALAAAAEVSPAAPPEIEYLNISAPLVLSRGGIRCVRLTLSPDDGRLFIRSRPRLSSEPWNTHASGRIIRAAAPPSQPEKRTKTDDESTHPRTPSHRIQPTGSVAIDRSARDRARYREDSADGPTRITADSVYRHAESLGLEYGEAFRKLEYVDVSNDSAVARIKAGEKRNTAGRNAYLLHPACLDASFHGLIGLLLQARREEDSGAAYIPVQTGRIACTGDVRAFTHAHIRLIRVGPRSITAHFELLDPAHRPVAILKNVRFRLLPLTRGARQTLPVYENRAVQHFPVRLVRAGALPSPDALGRVADATLAAQTPVLEREGGIRPEMPAIEMLVATFAAAAIGGPVGEGAWISRNQLAAALDVNDAQRPWFSQLLKLLEDSKFIERDNGRVRFSRVPDVGEAPCQWRRLLAEFPARHAELTLAGRCGMRLRDLLTGSIAHDALIGGAVLARLRAASPAFRSRDGVLRDLLTHLGENWADPRPLRMLE